MNNTTDSLSYFLGMGVVKKGTAEAPLSITVNCQGPGSFSQQCTFSATAPVELGVTDSPEEGYKAATANPGPTLTRTAGSLCGSSATLTIDAYLAEESWISAS